MLDQFAMIHMDLRILLWIFTIRAVLISRRADPPMDCKAAWANVPPKRNRKDKRIVDSFVGLRLVRSWLSLPI